MTCSFETEEEGVGLFCELVYFSLIISSLEGKIIEKDSSYFAN
jgi:hypothetical protein